MQDYLIANRRILFQAYRRYLAADRTLQTAQSAALAWLPRGATRKTMLIGNPGSHMRALHARRDRALARLELAKAEFENVRSRYAAKQIVVLRLTSDC